PGRSVPGKRPRRTWPPASPAEMPVNPGRSAAETRTATVATSRRYRGKREEFVAPSTGRRPRIGKVRGVRRLTRHAMAAAVLLACAGGAAAALLHQSRDLDASITSVALNGKVHARVF